MESPDPVLMRRLVREAIDIPLKTAGFKRAGRRNLWRRLGAGLVHGVGFYGSWVGGSRNFEWGVWVPAAERLLANEPRQELTEVAQCHLRGSLANLLSPKDFPERMQMLGGGVVPALSQADLLEPAMGQVHETVRLFLTALDRIPTPKDALSLLLESRGTRMLFWPGDGLIDIYAAAVAVAVGDPQAVELAMRAYDAMSSNPSWRAAAVRVADAAKVTHP